MSIDELGIKDRRASMWGCAWTGRRAANGGRGTRGGEAEEREERLLWGRDGEHTFRDEICGRNSEEGERRARSVGGIFPTRNGETTATFLYTRASLRGLSAGLFDRKYVSPVTLSFAHQGLNLGQGLSVLKVGFKHLRLDLGFLRHCGLGTICVVTGSLNLNR